MTGRARPGGPARAATRAWLLITCVALASACASGQSASRPASAHAGTTRTPAGEPSSSPGLDGCLPGASTLIRTVPDPGGGTLTVEIFGTGSEAVILSNESDENLCSWLPLARRLTTVGYRAVLWDYGGNGPQAELASVARWARKHGMAHLALIGASEGAKASLIAAARLGRAVRGVVSLSAESVLAPGILVVRSVARLHCPLLLVTAAGDPFGSAQATPEFMTAAPGPDKRLLTVPGKAHGTALLSGPAAATVLPAVLSFLQHALTR